MEMKLFKKMMYRFLSHIQHASINIYRIISQSIMDGANTNLFNLKNKYPDTFFRVYIDILIVILVSCFDFIVNTQSMI